LRYAAIVFNTIGICAWLPDILFQTTVAAITAPALGAAALQFIDLTFVLPAAAALTALILKPRWWLVFPALLLNGIVALLAVAVPAFLGEQGIRAAAQEFSSLSYFVALYIGFALVPSTTSAIALHKRLLS
jgi:hypothetical protein